MMAMLKVMLSSAISLFFATSFLFSQYNFESKYIQGMVQVDKTPSGTMYVLHTFSEGQSLYGISQFYDVPLYDLKRFNPDLVIGEEKLGQEINVPINDKHLIRDLHEAGAYQLLEKVFYQVEKGDTPYGIANRIFGIKLETLMSLNGMQEEEMTEGQFLHVAYVPAVGLNYFASPVKVKAVFYSPENEAFRNEFTEKGEGSKKMIEERGAAFWDKAAGEDFDFYVMHRNAPKNTIIALTNPDSGRTIYTKVLGKIPPIHPNKVIIVVSPKVAKQLGAVNANFFVSLSYYK